MSRCWMFKSPREAQQQQRPPFQPVHPEQKERRRLGIHHPRKGGNVGKNKMMLTIHLKRDQILLLCFGLNN